MLARSLVLSLAILVVAAPGLTPPAYAADFICSLDNLHPIQLRIQTADELRPGESMRAVIFLSSAIDLVDARVELVAGAGARLLVPRVIEVGSLAAGSPLRLDVDFVVDDQRDPVQIRARAHGEVPTGTLVRGATLHLLPQGRHAERVLVQDGLAKGGRQVLEHRGSARKVER